MPQLEISQFLTQYLWLLILLGVSYYKAVNSNELNQLFKIRKISTK